jgi:hypothetical protein
MALLKIQGAKGGVSFTRSIPLQPSSTYTVPEGSYAILTLVSSSGASGITVNGKSALYLVTANTTGTSAVAVNSRLKSGDVIATQTSAYALLEEWTL